GVMRLAAGSAGGGIQSGRSQRKAASADCASTVTDEHKTITRWKTANIPSFVNSSLHNKHDFVGGVERDVVIRELEPIRSNIIALTDIFLDSFSILASSPPANIDYPESSPFFPVQTSSNSSVNISVRSDQHANPDLNS